MSLDARSADIITFECDGCGYQQSRRGVRKFNGACRKCHGTVWSMITEYQEGAQAGGVLPLVLSSLFGVSVLNRHTETIRIVTPSVPADDALIVASAWSYKVGRVAYGYMERRRILDGERDREIMREHGGGNCCVCKVFFMPSPEKPWTASGYCSKACFAKAPADGEPRFVDSDGDPTDRQKQRHETKLTCDCGHTFDVSSMYTGTQRACPTCGKKQLVP